MGNFSKYYDKLNSKQKEARQFIPGFICAVCASLFFFLYAAPFAAASETILSFDSHVVVHKDSSMTVTETIKVRSERNSIRHGIYRDFPTTYTDYEFKIPTRYITGFDVKKVLRDGKPESHHFSTFGNGKRLYIGDRDLLLAPGDYTYTIVYKTKRQLGFFKDRDELFWNVTGNGWVFPIEAVSATVELPAGVPGEKIKVDGYTGYKGSRLKDFSAYFDGNGNPVFAATKKLRAYEGLTVLVAWPKGFVNEPTLGI